ncbi:unnamed protein product, partial [Rotaria socialis]
AQAYYWTNSFVFDTALIIATNHCTKGSSNVSLSSDNWQTPLGVVDIHIDLFNTFVSILEYARIHDKSILQSILLNDPKQLLETQWATQNSMCGLWASVIIMILSKILNNNKGHWKNPLLQR